MPAGLRRGRRDDLIAADIVVRGRRTADRSDVYLVVEVSWGVGKDEVECAGRRGPILAKLGTPALAAVACEFVTAETEKPIGIVVSPLAFAGSLITLKLQARSFVVQLPDQSQTPDLSLAV